MFLLARICHLSPAQVDETGFVDFLILVTSAKHWLEKVGDGGV